MDGSFWSFKFVIKSKEIFLFRLVNFSNFLSIAVEKAKQNSLMLQPQSGSGEFVRGSNADRKKLESQAQAIKAKKADSNRSLLLQPIPGSGVHKPRSSKKK